MSNCGLYTLAGLAKTCEASKGGISDIYITAYENVTGVTVSTGSTDVDVITGISMSGSTKFMHYHVRKGACSMTETLNVDAANGTNYVSTELNLQFTRMEAQKRLELKAMALNECAVIVKDANGEYWYLGEENPVIANGGASQTGQAVGDGNFYAITLTDENSSYPKNIKPSAVEAVVDEPTPVGA